MSDAAEQKVNFGLKNAYYAKITESVSGTLTYATPIKIQGAVELNLETRGDLLEFWADDMIYYSADNNQGYKGTLSIANVPQSFATDCLGEELDAIDKVITEKQGATQSGFALLFEFDNDVKATRHVLYYCKASRPNVASKTKTESVEPNVTELNFIASARPSDRYVKTKTTTATTDDIYNAWYQTVYGEGA
ncbi:phage major tail protein, phi13 family [Eubacterium aggregans]|uniref:Phage major tail protein, phi13 family n=1 Tax=Eubacterium aggregans TaxID=81409 RepID=A0A1H4BMV1_9FIRM|nr:major tail protein [Eubacterium aggregans]SEA49493.1 phage major tail protein, phi13 family [Eubacterium aggregans]